MEQSSEYVGLLVAFVISVTVACLIIFLNKILGPKNKGSAVKSEPFECGMPPLQSPKTGHFSVKFYLIAMLFILFDVEVVWFFPWAVILRELGWMGIFEMFSFVGILIIAFVYAWKKGALEWEK
jgi:NADH-quinone oxidoreductase subunit A